MASPTIEQVNFSTPNSVCGSKVLGYRSFLSAVLRRQDRIQLVATWIPAQSLSVVIVLQMSTFFLINRWCLRRSSPQDISLDHFGHTKLGYKLILYRSILARLICIHLQMLEWFLQILQAGISSNLESQRACVNVRVPRYQN